MRKLAACLFTFLFLCIFRVLFIPILGNSLATIASGFFSIIIALMFTFLLKEKIDLFLLKVYSAVMLLPVFFTDGVYMFYALDYCCLFDNSLFKIAAAFFETITPFIVLSGFSNKYLVQKLMISKDYLKKIVLIFIILLLVGHVLNLIGIQLPTMNSTPISTWGAQNIDEESLEIVKFRVTSFVGTSGPYALTMAYLFIAYAILNNKNKFYIFFIGFLVQVTSFSRSGFVILLIYVFVFYFVRINRISNAKNLILSKKSLLPIFGFLIFLIFLIYFYADLIIFQIQRIFFLLTLLNDNGNLDRFERMSMATSMIFSSFRSFFIGFGTGITSKTLGGEQYESQIVKLFIEWGLLGLSLFSYWLVKTFKLVNKKMIISIEYLPLASSVIFNLFVIQAFTSAPVFSAIGIALLAKNLDDLDKSSKILDISYKS